MDNDAKKMSRKEDISLSEIEKLISTIELCLQKAKVKEGFIELMAREGYIVRWGESSSTVITFFWPDGRKIRNRSLMKYTTCDLTVASLRKRFGMPTIDKSDNGKRNDERKNKISKFCETNSIEKKKHSYIYVLKLQDECYYVGFTNEFEKRLNKHFVTGNSTVWTKMHAPIEIIEVIDIGEITENESISYETAHTIEYMIKYGVDRVRGGDFVSANDLEIIHLLKTHGFGIKNGKPFSVSEKSKKYSDKRMDLQRMKACYRKG